MTTPAPDAPRVPLAVVTGGAAGIGRAVAERLATDGFRVVCADVVQHDLPALDLGAVPDAPGLVWAPLDVTDHAAVRAAFDGLAAAFGGIDALVNNAGIQRHRALEDLTWDEWSAVVDVNLHGVFSCLQAAGRHMLAAGRGGSIVLTSSAGGIQGIQNFAHYVAAKHGVIGLMRTLANEVAPARIRVNAVVPGTVLTDMAMNEPAMKLFRPDLEHPTLDDVRDAMQSMHALPTPWLEPVDVSNAILWLASEEARWVTGVVLPVDAGWINKSF